MDNIKPPCSKFSVSKPYFCYIPPDKYLLCSGCKKLVPQEAELHDTRPCFAKFKCQRCSRVFYWCRVCPPTSSYIRSRHMTTERQLHAHETYDHHIKNVNKLIGVSTVSNDDVSICDEVEPLSLVDDVEMLELPAPDMMDSSKEGESDVAGQGVDFMGMYPGHRNAQFFEYQAQGPGFGTSKIASMAIHHDELHAVGLITSLYMLLLTIFVDTLTTLQAELLTALLRFFVQSPKMTVPLPTNVPVLNEMFGDGTKFSVKSNIPRMELHQCGEYVVAKPSDCLREALAFGLTDTFFPGDAVLQAKSPRGQRVIEYAMRFVIDGKSQVILLELWEDDIDPFNVKDNRHKVFVQVLTVGPKDATIHTTRNTFIICLGKSSADRTAATSLIVKDLEMLSRGIYCHHGTSKKVVHTIALVFSIQADSPAKAAALEVLAGNSRYHTQFGIVGDISAVIPRLKSCSECWKARRDGLPPVLECSKCHDWCLEGLPYPTPSDYPPNGHEEGMKVGKTLTFKKLSTNSLKQSSQKIYNNVVSGLWEKRSWARCFGKTEGLAVPLVDSFYDSAKCSGGFSYPNSWDYPNVDISSWVPVPMHLLFLGVVKAVMGEFVVEWLASNKQRTAFVQFATARLKHLRKFNLDWLKAETFSSEGKFGRFVSENYLAFAKVCKWLVAGMGTHAPLDPIYSDPEGKSIEDYTVSELKQWLKARKLKYSSKDRKEDLYNICLAAITSCNGNFPPIPPANNRRATLEQAENMVSAMHSMISRVMLRGAVTTDDALDCDHHVKHFLSTVAEFLSDDEPDLDIPQVVPGTNGNTNNKKRPEYITKYNFMNLLSVPNAMLDNYSLRLLWEGDGKGEGALPFLKQHCIKSIKGIHWQMNIMKHYYEKRGLARVTANHVDTLDKLGVDHYLKKVAASLVRKDMGLHDTDDTSAEFTTHDTNAVVDHHSTSGKRNHYVYKDSESFEAEWNQEDTPVSIICLKDSSFVGVCKGNCLVDLVCRNIPAEKKEHCGVTYFKWSVAGLRCPSIALRLDEIEEDCLLLPHHDSNNHPNYYYLITSDWKEMLFDGSIGRSRAMGVAYS